MDGSPTEPIDWSQLAVGETAAQLDTSLTGLSTDEAATRLERFGQNKIEEERGRLERGRFLTGFDHGLGSLSIEVVVEEGSRGAKPSQVMF